MKTAGEFWLTLDLCHGLGGTHTHSQTTTSEGQRLQRASERPPVVTYSLFTNRSRQAASARCARAFVFFFFFFVGGVCRGSDERGHLCGWTSLFRCRLPVMLYCSFTPTHSEKREKNMHPWFLKSEKTIRSTKRSSERGHFVWVRHSGLGGCGRKLWKGVSKISSNDFGFRGL